MLADAERDRAWCSPRPGALPAACVGPRSGAPWAHRPIRTTWPWEPRTSPPDPGIPLEEISRPVGHRAATDLAYRATADGAGRRGGHGPDLRRV